MNDIPYRLQSLCPLRSFLFAAMIAMSPLALAQTTWVVDDDGAGSATDCDAPTAASATIQGAVNAASAGDTILVCPGTYDEQVVVATDDITIRGAGTGSTVVRPSAVVANATGVVTPVPVPASAIVLVDGARNVTLQDFTIDGGAADSGESLNLTCGFTPHYLGIFYLDSSGTVDGMQVANVTSATSCGFAIRVESVSTTSNQVELTGNLVENYGFGITCAGFEVECTIAGNTLRGEGPVADRVQAGILVRSGAVASIFGNTITDHWHLGAHGAADFSVGIFLVAADPRTNAHLLRDNVFSGNQLNVQRLFTEAALH